MKLDIYATFPHYVDHLAPVWKALHPFSRGTFYVHPSIAGYARSMGLAVSEVALPINGRPTLVAGSGDMHMASQVGRRIAIMEHGSGQSFGGDLSRAGIAAAQNSSYAGGEGRIAELFLHPGEHPATRERARYPDAQVEVVGCPKLDTLPARVPDGKTVVAISFHWDTALAPETRSSFLFYRAQLAETIVVCSERNIEVIGHGHPRIIARLKPWWERQGVEVVGTFAEVCKRADVYACDGVSTLYEFASTGRPVIVLNAPFYRKDVDHGLRFWNAASVGPQVDEPYDLREVIAQTVARPHTWDSQREVALDLVYAYRTGAAARTARVLEAWSRTISA